MKRTCILLMMLFTGLGLSLSASAQGLPAKAFKNVTVHKSDGSTINDAVIVWRDGLIEIVGKNEEIPFDAKVWDGGDSLHVYPGFINGYAYWGSPDQQDFEETPSRGNPSYERAGIRPGRHARERVKMDSDDFKSAMKAGFTTAALATKGYMIPGQLDLFFLQPELEIDDLYEAGIGMQMQFEESQRVYPSTVMGIMAQLEQLILNAQALCQKQEYFASNPNQMAPPDNNPTLEALYPVMDNEQRVFFKVDTKEMIERVFSLQDSLGFDVVIVSGMEAYKVADELNNRDIPVLASIDFPEKPKWKKDDKEKDEEGEKKKEEKAEQQKELSEQEKAYREKRWQAYLKMYKNINTLMDAGVQVGFATADLELKKMGEKFKDWDEYGEVDPNDMLQVMTLNTAEILNKAETLGEIESGKVANFTVMSKPFMDEESKTLYSVSDGTLTEFDSEE